LHRSTSNLVQITNRTKTLQFWKHRHQHMQVHCIQLGHHEGIQTQASTLQKSGENHQSKVKKNPSSPLYTDMQIHRNLEHSI
jgi:Zn ribbon nucleic-acid-binding protein